MGFAVRFREPELCALWHRGLGCGRMRKGGSGGRGRVHTYGWLVLTKAETAPDYKAIILHPPGKNEKQKPTWSPLHQWSSAFCHQGLVSRNSGFRRWRQEEKVQDGSRARHLLCASFLLSLHQIRLRLSGIRSQRLGTPALNPPEEKSLLRRRNPSISVLWFRLHIALLCF